MKYIRRIYKLAAFIIAVCLSSQAHGQGQFTNMGKDFIFGFSNNYNLEYNQVSEYSQKLHLEFKIVTSKETNVTITYNFDNTTESFTIPANTVYSKELTDAERNKVYAKADGKDKRTVRVEADNNITIYAINLTKYTTDATAILPTNNWGKSYLLLSVNKTGYGATTGGYTIIAKEDGTSVVVDGQGTITLNKNEIYRITAATSASFGGKITSNKDIAVFGTHVCTNWPSGACDHQWEQLVPSANFGKEFLVPKAGLSSEYMRIAAVENNTIVSINMNGSTTTHTLNTGAIYDFQLTNDAYIVADKQIGVVAHIGGTSVTNSSLCGGDPAFAWVPPIEQHINRAYIAPFVTSKSAIVCHYILLMTKKENKGQTKINGVIPSTGWRDHASGYSVLLYQMPTLIPYEVQNDKGIVVMAYGIGQTESYYYLAASSARKLDASFYVTNDGNKYHYQDADFSIPFDCGSPFEFEAVIQYELSTAPGHLKWYVDGTEVVSARDRLTWTQSYLSGGSHTIKLVVTDSYGVAEDLETTLKVECATDMNPKTATLNEGQTQQMKITLSGTAPTAITFNLSAHTGTTASPADYSFPAAATIAAGGDEVTFNVVAEADNIINEPNEVLVLRAYNSEYGELFSTITIKDVSTTAQKTLTLSVDPDRIYEPHTGITPSPIQTAVKVSLPAGVTTYTAIPVSLTYTGSTATLNNDYSLTPTTAASSVTIPGGGTSASFVVKALEDNLYEEDELVKIAASATGYTMGTGSVAVTIKDQTPSDIIVATLLDAEEAPASVTGKFQIRFKKTDVRTKKKIEILYKLTGVANDGTVYDLISPTSATIPIDSYAIDVEIKPKNNYIVEGAREVAIELLSVNAIP